MDICVFDTYLTWSIITQIFHKLPLLIIVYIQYMIWYNFSMNMEFK